MRPDLVARPELLERLDGGLHARLTLVSAPAGSGKSTLLGAWRALHAQSPEARARVTVAWLALDEGDNDPVRFWHYLIAAIETAQPGLLAGMATFFPRLSQEPEVALTGLINALSASARTLALILDDYHLIETQAIHDAFTFLLEHLPPHIHLFMASRVDPPLPLARLRARGQLQELRAAELRFTRAEVSAFLLQATGQALSESEISALDARVEGWIAGLQLMALSLRGRSERDSLITSFSGNHRYIMDYLTGEVLDHLPTELHSFLLQTSILERLNAALCNAVTGRDDSQQMLEQLEQRNLFVIPLDDVREWYRYHHLFADVLRKRLLASFPEQSVEMHRRAATWFKHAGLFSAAVEHALAGRDFDFAARLIESEYGKMIARGEVVTLMRWVNALPPSLVEANIRLLMGRLWALAGVGRWEEADLCLQDVERRAGESASRDFLGNLFSARASLLSGRGDTHHAAQFLQKALAYTQEQNFSQRSYILLNMAMVHWANNDLELMRRTLVESWEAGLAGKHSYVALGALCNLARLHYASGNLAQAQTIYQQALRYIAENSHSTPDEPELPGAGFTYQGMGALLYEINDLEGASHYFARSSRLAWQTGDARLMPALFLEHARLQLALGEPDRARIHLRELEDYLAREMLLAYHQPIITLCLVQLYLAIGERARAHAWLREHYLPELAAYPLLFIHEPVHCLAARIYLDQGKYADSLELLHKLASVAEADGRDGSLLGILVLCALALQAQGTHDQAIEALGRALMLGERGGYVRTFVDEGAPLVTLLREMLVRQQKHLPSLEYRCSPDYILRLLALSGHEIEPPAEQAARGEEQAYAGLLSSRELEVLRLVSSGLSNQEISARLVIAPSTLKTHINHIYSKLDARNRVQAVGRARALGLL